jgi:hypothetical protein
MSSSLIADYGVLLNGDYAISGPQTGFDLHCMAQVAVKSAKISALAGG